MNPQPDNRRSPVEPVDRIGWYEDNHPLPSQLDNSPSPVDGAS